MSEAQRPKIVRRPKPQDNSTFGLSIDGEEFVVTPADLTGLLEMRIRKEIGLSVTGLFGALQTDPGVDYLGMWKWVARIARGDECTLEECLKSVSYDSDLKVLENPESDLPEASGGS